MLGITTQSVAVGTPLGDQFNGLLQSEPVVPDHVFEPLTVPVPVLFMAKAVQLASLKAVTV